MLMPIVLIVAIATAEFVGMKDTSIIICLILVLLMRSHALEERT